LRYGEYGSKPPNRNREDDDPRNGRPILNDLSINKRSAA